MRSEHAKSTLQLILFGVLFQIVISMYPDAIIKVQPECASTTDGVTRISLTSDAPVFYGYAKCHQGYTHNFTEVDMANHELFVHYVGDESTTCLFDKKQRSRTYTLQVYVVVGTDNGVLMDEQFYLITCTYDPHATEESGVKDFRKGLNPAQEITVNKGGRARSTIQLAAVDILGNEIPGSLTLGTKIQLRAQMTESAQGEASFHPLTCKASALGVQYPILIAGCGDGRILPGNTGFTTVGKMAVSPPFKTFRLKGARSLTFTCTYYICREECEGSNNGVTTAGVTSINYNVMTLFVFITLAKNRSPTSRKKVHNSCISSNETKDQKRRKRDLRPVNSNDSAVSEESNDIDQPESVKKGIYSSSVQYYIHDHDIGQVVFGEDAGSGDLDNLLDPSQLRTLNSDSASGPRNMGLLVAMCISSAVAVTSICAIVCLLYKTKKMLSQDESVSASAISVRSYSTNSIENENFVAVSSGSLPSLDRQSL